MADEHYLIPLESMMRETGVSADRFPAHCPPFESIPLSKCIKVRSSFSNALENFSINEATCK